MDCVTNNISNEESGIWAWDIQSGQLTWTDAVYQIFGFYPGEIQPDYALFLSMVYEDDRANLDNAIKSSIDTSGPYSINFRIRRKDGKLVLLHANGQAICENGIPVRMLGVCRDITEDDCLQQKLSKTEVHLKEAQSMAHIGSWELDLANNQLEWSDEIYHLFQIDADKFNPSYESFLNAIHPDDRDMVNQAYQSSLKNKIPYSIVHRLLLPDGSIRYVHEQCQTDYDEQGNPLRSFGTVQDITEQFTIENSLKKSNRAMQMLSACNTLLLHIDDEDELIHGVCRLITEYMGYRMAWFGYAEHNNEKTIKPVVSEGYEEGYLDDIQLSWADNEYGQGPTGTAIRTGKVSIMQDILSDPKYANWRESALERGYQSSISLPLIYREHTYGALNIYAYEACAFDDDSVDLLKQLAGDLAFGIHNIRSQKERSQLNLQLQQAQKMEAIGQLTGGIAHDFNNILSSIMGFTNLAIQRYVTDEQSGLKAYLDEVMHAGERARDLVRQLMDYSRTSDSQPVFLDLTTAVREVVKMLHATLPASIKLSYYIEKEIPSVLVSPVNFHQILMNLCINARDAINDQGEISIGIKTVLIEDGLPENNSQSVCYTICSSCNKIINSGDYVEVSVSDTGSGIQNEHLTHIFEPFYTTKTMDKGTGMGLSVLHGLVHQAGGHILVDTHPDRGTVFKILLPSYKNIDQITHTDSSSIPGNKNILDGLHLLVVDDDLSVGRFMNDLLTGYGAQVVVESRGQAALDKFSENPDKFDLLITDQTMPDMSGTELAQRMQKIKPELQIILCTGFSETVDEKIAKSLGFAGYFSKPLEIRKLIELIHQLMSAKS